jgi:hypothetical protein
MALHRLRQALHRQATGDGAQACCFSHTGRYTDATLCQRGFQAGNQYSLATSLRDPHPVTVFQL